MNRAHIAGCVALFIGAAIAFYYANQSSGVSPVPEIQTEDQVMGMGVRAGISYNANTHLDMNPALHFWAPGFNENLVGLPPSEGGTVKTPHRYPALPGGNISTVMHKGWSGLESPACNDWFRNPPEAAVL